VIVSVKQIAGLGPENFSIMPEGVAHAGGLGETPAGAARWVQGGEAGPATHALVLSLRKPESYLGGRLARRLTAAPHGGPGFLAMSTSSTVADQGTSVGESVDDLCICAADLCAAWG
jgi:hypothetical protein